MSKYILLLICLWLGACTGNPSGDQGSGAVSPDYSANQAASPTQASQAEGLEGEETPETASCPLRPLNPEPTPSPTESELDRYFRLGYDAATAGDFETAIANYNQAAELATCECERSHAEAGEEAATEAQALVEAEGTASKPTQFFWVRLQELTESLSCIESET